MFKSMNKKKKVGLLAGASGILGAVLLGGFLMMPTSSFTLDVNPSIEIKTNRLDRVVSVNPLNQDAENLLKDFKLKEKDIDDVIEDLVDRMILTGHISGGDDNLIMITVDDESVPSEDLAKINKAIAAYLENRQIEAAIAAQAIDINKEDKKLAGDYQISPGKLELIRKVMDDDDLDLEEMSSIKLNELVVMAKALNIKPNELFDEYLDAIEDAVEDHFNDGDDKDDFDDIDDYRDTSKKNVIKTVSNADNGVKKVTNNGANSNTNKVASNATNNVSNKGSNAGKNKTGFISRDEAKKIALGLAKGEIFEFELDEDDGRYIYEIEIKGNGMEYEIELDARTGKVLEFEKDDDDDDYDDRDDD